jgi:hypothetical protein
MTRFIIILALFSIATCLVHTYNLNILDQNYYILAKSVKDLDISIAKKEDQIALKMIDRVQELHFFSEIVEKTINLQNRVDILELQVADLQYRLNDIEGNKLAIKNIPFKRQAIQQQEATSVTDNLHDDSESYIPKKVNSELDEASSATVNLKEY